MNKKNQLLISYGLVLVGYAYYFQGFAIPAITCLLVSVLLAMVNSTFEWIEKGILQLILFEFLAIVFYFVIEDAVSLILWTLSTLQAFFLGNAFDEESDVQNSLGKIVLVVFLMELGAFFMYGWLGMGLSQFVQDFGIGFIGLVLPIGMTLLSRSYDFEKEYTLHSNY